MIKTEAKKMKKQHAELEQVRKEIAKAEQERDTIRRTAERLEEPYRSILLLKFCQREKLFNWEMQEQLGYGATRFYELQNEAFLQFAECFKGGELLTFRTD